MKNYKRAERRHRAKCKLERRIKKWVIKFHYITDDSGNRIKVSGKNLEFIRQQVLNGNAFVFLRHTSSPCDCSMCQYPKYKRERKYQWMKRETKENEI